MSTAQGIFLVAILSFAVCGSFVAFILCDPVRRLERKVAALEKQIRELNPGLPPAGESAP